MIDNPNIQRISLEEIQEFKDLDLFSLTWEQTNGRLVLLAYDPQSQTFGYSYTEAGTDGGDQNLSLFYGKEDLIADFIDNANAASRPSINGFDNGDGIIAANTVGTVTKFDFYDVVIDIDQGLDEYVFQQSVIGGAAIVNDVEPTVVEGGTWFAPTSGLFYVGSGGAWVVISGGGSATIVNDVEPAVVNGGSWFQPTLGTFYIGVGGVWQSVAAKGDTGDTGGQGVPGTPGTPGADGPGISYIFFLSDSATAPITPIGIGDPVGWTDSPTGVSQSNRYEYVSLATYSDAGGWTTYSVPALWARFAIDGDPVVGDPGTSYKTSTVFTRTSTRFDEKTIIVTGGHFSDPFPTLTKIDSVNANPAIVWSDGIPAGDEKVWMTTFTFNDDAVDVENPANVWTVPRGITDTSTTDYQYSILLSSPGAPDTNPANWAESVVDETLITYIAQRNIKNGIFGPWVVIHVKGETGLQGNGLDIQGRDTPCNILNKAGVADYDIWIANQYTSIADMITCSGITMDADAQANDAFLKVPDGTGEGGSNWDNIGGVVGTDGASFKYSIVFKRSVGVPATPTGGTFAVPVPAGWSDGIPAITVPFPEGQQLWQTTRHFSDDPTSNAALASWITPVVAGDTIDQEVEYALEQPGNVIPSPPNVAPSLWSDVYGTTDYVWSATAKKINGVVDTTSWIVRRMKGEIGLTGNDGENAVGNFQALAYVRTETDISNVTVSGGTYASPLPTTTAAGKAWVNNIPSGGGAVWFTQVKMLQTDTGAGKVWPNPIKIIDSSSIEYRFSSQVSKPLGLPIVNDVTGINSWWDDADQVPGGVPTWMAIGSISNNIWPTVWDIISVVGPVGPAGTGAYTYVPSTMFVRSDAVGFGAVSVTGKYLTKVNNVYTLDGPEPVSTVGGYGYEWSDGIPEYNEAVFPNNGKRVWMIQGVLNSNDNLGVGNEYSWGLPTVLADNGSIDYQYHAGASATAPGSKPIPPTGTGSNPDNAGWYDYPESVPTGAFWLAQKNWSEGPSAQWVVYQIRGENGADAVAGSILFSTPVEVTKYTEPGPLNACQVAQTAGQGGVADDGIIRYFSGLYPGDYIAVDSQGVTRYNGADEWISSSLISWRVDWDGKILERVVCPSWAVVVPSNVTATRSLEYPTKIQISWSPSSSEVGVLSGYVIERSTTLGGSRSIVGNVGVNTLTLLDEPANAGTYYYTVYAKSLDPAYNSTRSAAASIQFVKTVLMTGDSYRTLGDLVGAFINSFSSNAPRTNTPFYTTSPSLQVGSYFSATVAGAIPFNGNRYWYANYSTLGNAGTAYQIDEYGIVIATGPVVYTYVEGTPPTAPSNLTISVDGGNLTVKGFRLNWNGSTDNVAVTGYQVWVHPTENFGNYYLATNTLGVGDLTTVVMVDQCDMGQGITYFKVRAFDAAGNFSAFSNIVSGYGDGCA